MMALAAAAILQEEPADLSADILARTLFGEARSEGLAGIEAIAGVVMNRFNASRQAQAGCNWGSNVAEICRKPWQFSCWSPANLPRLMAVKAGDPIFDLCLRVARRAVAGRLTDRTKGATHYHARELYPLWAKGLAPCVEIGVHLFYRDML